MLYLLHTLFTVICICKSTINFNCSSLSYFQWVPNFKKLIVSGCKILCNFIDRARDPTHFQSLRLAANGSIRVQQILKILTGMRLTAKIKNQWFQ